MFRQHAHARMHPSVAPSASTVFGCVDFDDCDDCDGVFRPLFHIAATRWVARSPSRKRVQRSRHTKRRFRPRCVGAVCVVRRHTTRMRPFRWAAQRCFVPKWGRTCLRKACRTRAVLAVLAWRGPREQKRSPTSRTRSVLFCPNMMSMNPRNRRVGGDVDVAFAFYTTMGTRWICSFNLIY